MFDVTALGELLIDFTPAGVSGQGNICFERNPGGAPANVLACVSKLGGKTAFIGKVGDDLFGRYLESTLKAYKIATSGLKFSKEANTTLAFVQLDDRGDREFSFYRNPGADTMLETSELNYEAIKNSKVFHFGSLSLTHEPSAGSTLQAVEFAKKSGCTISYDPNLRPALWESLDIAKERILSVLSYVDILKISEEELEFITGERDIEKGSDMINHKFPVKLILVTRGGKGCFYRLGGITGFEKAFEGVRVIDTTGAGDAFLGGMLHSLLSGIKKDIDKLNEDDIRNSAVFSNAVAALCTTKKGAIPAMPDLNEVYELINKRI